MRGHSVSSNRKFNRHWQSAAVKEYPLVGDIIYTCNGGTVSETFSSQLEFECGYASLNNCSIIRKVEFELNLGTVPNDIIINPYIGMDIGYNNGGIDYSVNVDSNTDEYLITSGLDGYAIGGIANIIDVQAHFYGSMPKLVYTAPITNANELKRISAPVTGYNNPLGYINHIDVNVTPQASGTAANDIINNYVNSVANVAYMRIKIYGV